LNIVQKYTSGNPENKLKFAGICSRNFAKALNKIGHQVSNAYVCK
jgi:hypothetical protein